MWHGGSRYGAGRPGWHVRAEVCRRIDVRQWSREGALIPGGGGVWVWRDSKDASFRVDGDTAILHHDLTGRPMTQRLPILRTPCHLGGQRSWWGCPACARRVAVLFLRPAGFACRRCAQVAYTSQTECATDRAERRLRRAGAYLGPRGVRPKGMRLATYRAALDRLDAAEQGRLQVMAAAVEKLSGR